VAATVVLVGCDAFPGPALHIKGDVRGIPPATTAYTKVVVARERDVRSAVRLPCTGISESHAVIDSVVQSVRNRAVRRAISEALPECIREKMDGGDNESGACGMTLRDFRALPAVRAATTRARDSLLLGAQRLRDSLVVTALRATDSLEHRFSTTGSFDITVRDPALLSYITVASPGQYAVAQGPRPRRSDVASVIAYDQRTFAETARLCVKHDTTDVVGTVDPADSGR
jgi:hypothetical protein